MLTLQNCREPWELFGERMKAIRWTKEIKQAKEILRRTKET